MTFESIYQAVMLAIGDAQYSRTEEVKAVVNMIYLNEICSCDELYPLFWLYEIDDDKRSKAPVTAITSITKATPPVVTSIAHGLATGDVVQFYDVVGMTELNYRQCHVTRLTADTFSLQDLTKTNIAGLGYGAAGTSGKAHHRGTLITACKGVLSPNWHGYESMDPASVDQLSDETTWLDDTTSLPISYQHRRVITGAYEYDYLLWFPSADAAYWLYLPYIKQPTALSNTTDVPILPAQHHHTIVAGAVARLGVNAVQVEAGVVWPGLYQQGLAAIRAYNREWWSKFKETERQKPYLL